MTPRELIAVWQQDCARHGYIARDFPERLWDDLASRIFVEYLTEQPAKGKAR